MSVKPAKIQFNGGELSPWLAGRIDIAKYDKTARLCRNFIPLIEGSLKRRGGSRFVAETPETSEVTFTIQTVPFDAKVLINGMVLNSLKVACGDMVNYEVSADGYETVSGQICVTKTMSLNVVLVSMTERFVLTVDAVPDNAVVKIAGCERNVYSGKKGENVSVIVYCNQYKHYSEQIKLNTNEQRVIHLLEDDGNDYDYGDWGIPVGFVACSAYGQKKPQKKCFLIRFLYGYLPIIFDAHLISPREEDIDESLFVYSSSNKYNSAYKTEGGALHLAAIYRQGDVIYYAEQSGQLMKAFEAKKNENGGGWQRDENDEPAALYKSYDGYLTGKEIKVCYKGEFVWSLKGRKNG